MATWQPVTVPTAGSVVSTTTFGTPVADNMADSGWIAVTFQNSWSNFTGGYTAKYRRIGNRVMLQGIIQGGTSGTTAFTLPSGFVPADANPTPTWLVVASSASAYVYIGSTSSGSPGIVVPNNMSGSNVSTLTSLSGISFLVD